MTNSQLPNWLINTADPPEGLPAMLVWDGEHGSWITPEQQGQIPTYAGNNQIVFANPGAGVSSKKKKDG